MSDDVIATELLARIERLEADNRRLSAQLDRITGPGEPAVDQSDTPVARRGLLRRVGGMALGVAAVSAAGPIVNAAPAAAADGEPLIMGRINQSAKPTTYRSDADAAAAIQVHNIGEGPYTTGTYTSGAEIGLLAEADQRVGVLGQCPKGFKADKIDRAGVGGVGSSGAVGVMGVSDSAAGVFGRSAGRGGTRNM